MSVAVDRLCNQIGWRHGHDGRGYSRAGPPANLGFQIEDYRAFVGFDCGFIRARRR